jgi:hypothetical protein
MFPADAPPHPSMNESSVIVATLLLLQQATPPSADGRYWQQEVAYEIAARLDEPTGVLSGTERWQMADTLAEAADKAVQAWMRHTGR